MSVKRSVSSREVAGPTRLKATESFTIDPSLTIEDAESESESDESYYPELGSEPDTEDEETSLEAAWDAEDAEDAGSDEEESNEALYSASPSLEHDVEGLSREGDEGKEGEGGEEAEKGRETWQEAEETDTSDEEEVRNTVGNIPLEWYEDYPHIGYDLEGKKMYKPARGDELDEFLAKMDDPSYWRTVRDKFTGKEVVLSDQQLDMVQRIQRAEYPDASHDPYEPYVDHFTCDKMLHPLSDVPKPKSSFVPSRWEHRKIVKLVHAIRMGWIKMKTQPEKPKFYMLWDDSKQADCPKHRMHIPAPKMKLPGHEESYNPPPEYLPSQEEAKEWHEMEPEDRSRNFLPHKYGSLREVPAYPNFIQERFERCLDLYLCPRQRKMRVQVDPEDLIPKLPKPKDLYPFPTTETIVYEGHSGLVRCVSVEPLGQWIASGSDDETVRVWEVTTGRCVRTLQLPGRPLSVAFCPNSNLTLLAAAIGNSVHLINHGLGDKLVVSATDTSLSSLGESQTDPAPHSVTWQLADQENQRQGFKMSINHTKAVKQVVWHGKGDYFATVLSDAAGSAVYIHQLSKRRSQNPFKKLKGSVQKVMFHPLRPFFFVATQTYVKVYNLAKQELTKKLHSGVKWVSSIDIHPQGDNLIIGSYDKRLCWFDMDLSNKPYKVIRHHKQAIRQVCYHARYPLFASCSDDAAVIVCHGMVYNDLMQNPLIVPVKVLKGHSIINSLGVLDCQFHPTQPWIFTAGADSTLRLYT